MRADGGGSDAGMRAIKWMKKVKGRGAGFLFKTKIDMAIILILLYIYASELRDSEVRLTENEKNQELKRFSGSMVAVSVAMCVHRRRHRTPHSLHIELKANIFSWTTKNKLKLKQNSINRWWPDRMPIRCTLQPKKKTCIRKTEHVILRFSNQTSRLWPNPTILPPRAHRFCVDGDIKCCAVNSISFCGCFN